MKNSKGTLGYLTRRKRTIILKNILEFGVVICLAVLGYVQTKTRMNLLTVVAVLGCLPAAKALVELIMILPHRSLEKEKAEEIQSKTQALTVAYDMVVTSEKKTMPIACIAISDNTVCGYVANPKVNLTDTSKYLMEMLEFHKCGHVVVKLFDNYTAFLTRAEGMNNIAVIEKNDTKSKEETIKRLILNISL